MNILIVSMMELNSPSGVRVYYERLAKELETRGHTVKVITPRMSPGIVRYATAAMHQVFRVFGRGAFLMGNELKTFVRIFMACKRVGSIDIIHAQDVTSGVAAASSLSWSKPIVVSCHFNDHPLDEMVKKFALKGLAIHFLSRWFDYMFSKIDNYICVSTYVEERVRLFAAPKRTFIVYNGVDFDAIDKTQPPERLVEKYRGKKVVLNVGTLERRKNQLFIVKLAGAIKSKVDDIVFVLVGEGEDRQLLADEIRSQRLEKAVELYGESKEVISLLKISTLYFHTALNENSGLAIIEAIAARVPVLALDVGGVREAIPAETGGLLAPEFSMEHVAELFSQLMNDEKKRKAMMEEQYEYGQHRHQLSTMVDSTLKVYQSLLATQKSVGN
jgi:glycosyltransferase involved in cell wall biosynthesis